MTTAVGYTISSRDFPLALTPGEASVKRGKIHTLLGNPDVECVIYWIDPGTEPPAVRKSQAELRQQLRSIGYIE
jgi:hypothetical protein